MAHLTILGTGNLGQAIAAVAERRSCFALDAVVGRAVSAIAVT